MSAGAGRRIGVSMRELRAPATGELHDALAASWGDFLCWALPDASWFPLPNVGADAARIARDERLDGLVLSGGDDIGASARRDGTERALLAWSAEGGVPTLGVCRGAQMMWHDAGGALERVEGHVATRHALTWTPESDAMGAARAAEVNSYHSWSLPLRSAPAGVVPLALAADGSVEALRLANRPWFAIMWHPERELPHADSDRAFVRAALRFAPLESAR